MTDNSKIALRWVIDDATATFARRKAESGVFNEGGFKWIVALVGGADPDRADLTLRCDVDHNESWKCELEVDMYCQGSDGEFYPHFFKMFNIDDKSTHELRINIISSESNVIDLSKFCSPNEASNVTLLIGDKNLRVSKDYLAIHSPVFAAMFFGNFVENGKEEVEIKYVVYEEFVDLLNLIYHKTEITDRSVPHILKLSDQFQMESILKLSKKHLTRSKGLDTMKKLLMADQYRLDSLRDQCLQSFTSTAQVMEKLKTSPEYAKFSDGLKAAICDRLTDF